MFSADKIVQGHFVPEPVRQRYAGHTNANIQAKHYTHTNAADGQAAFFGKPGRKHILDLFRTFSIPRNPSLWQCLPAEKQYELENSQEFLELEEKLIALESKVDNKAADYREKLLKKRRELKDRALRTAQKQQPIEHNDSPGYHRSLFGRVRFKMPPRDRLATDLFKAVPLRSPTGLACLRDLIELYQQRTEVEYRPGLEPDKCNCQSDVNADYDWRHIYWCYKKEQSAVHGCAELCFLCNEWFFDSEAWKDHCQGHLDDSETFPVWWDPLIYAGVLATAGYCRFCFADARLPATTRMQQFLNTNKWLAHIHRHVEDIEKSCKPPVCPDSRHYCNELFESVRHLEFHLQDHHGVPYRKPAKLKRPREDEDINPIQRKRRRQCNKWGVKDEDKACSEVNYVFINSTAETISGPGRIKSEPTSSISTPLYNSDMETDEEKEISCAYETPPSSVWSDDLIDPDLRQALSRAEIEVVDLTKIGDMFEPSSVVAVQRTC